MPRKKHGRFYEAEVKYKRKMKPVKHTTVLFNRKRNR